MPLPTDKSLESALGKKKTKSRNGCARCKLKRLKCDERQPSCFQCQKRNSTCPGYEKTLKWSTKYEILQPCRVEFAYSGPFDVPYESPIRDPSLPVEVLSGFQALAEALPVRKSWSHDKGPNHGSRNQPGILESAVSKNADAILSECMPAQQTDVMDPSSFSKHMIANIDFDLDLTVFDDGGFPDVTLEEDLSVPGWPSQPSLDKSHSEETSSRLPTRSMLLDFYRLPGPSTSRVLDTESMLVGHYFKDVCVLFSSFDSLLNPFRTTIARIFQESSSIYYAIQSMAAAHLANTFPSMTEVGIQMQRKACDSLQAELPLAQSCQASSTITFLSTILLGITTCWHESSALGEEFLATARSLVLPKLLREPQNETARRETQFFEESLIYWEMLMGFVTQDTVSSVSVPRKRNRSKGASSAARDKHGKIVPHPWTGIAPSVQMLFAEVGRLVRKERMLRLSGPFERAQRQEILDAASSLEEDVLAVEYPSEDELCDPGDERTSKRDFIVMAEAYRCASLLELYRVFPSLLRQRFELDNHFSWADKANSQVPPPRYGTQYEDTDTKLSITSLAIHILDSLASLPSSSGTCFLQLILLVAAASELTFVSSIDYFDVYANDTKVLQAREFADRRLHEYALRLPGKPVRKMIDLVREVWWRLDGGGDAFWIDVMVEKGWHTVMG